jgi:hypothetical protein
MLRQAVRAARLDRTVYTELYFDGAAVANAVIVVALVGALSALPALLAGEFFLFFGIVIGSLFGWVVLTFAVYLMGTRVFHGRADFQKLLASTGFAHAPLLLLGPMLFALGLAGLGLVAVVSVVIWVWYLVALAIAVEQTMELNRRDAVLTALLGFAVWFGISLLFGRGLF